MGKNGGRLLCQINLEVLIKFYFCHVKSPPHLKMQFLFRGSLVFLINPGYQAHDTIRWKDVIFENNQMGSITTKDTLFRKRYGRGILFLIQIPCSPSSILKRQGRMKDLYCRCITSGPTAIPYNFGVNREMIPSLQSLKDLPAIFNWPKNNFTG